MKNFASQSGAPSSTLKEEAQLSRNVKIAVREYGQEHADVALALVELGDFYFSEERFVDSTDAFKRAVDIYEALGEGHQLLSAMAMRSMSNSLILQGKYADAVTMNENARELIQRYQ
ncbi:MAG: tetratricopeptide repeat protein [Candidatus Melainabacteria bacterium]|nr:tetratricopeptide repeat protein [Candidatus Melainabacteria bacterium]